MTRFWPLHAQDSEQYSINTEAIIKKDKQKGYCKNRRADDIELKLTESDFDLLTDAKGRIMKNA